MTQVCHSDETNDSDDAAGLPRLRGLVRKVCRLNLRRAQYDTKRGERTVAGSDCRAPIASSLVEQRVPSVHFRFLRFAALVLLALGLSAMSGSAHAQVNISPPALNHYSYCIEQATQFNFVFPNERGVTYRCRDEVAVAYFNDLGRRRQRADRIADNVTGVYVLRPIWGIGYCWHKIENELRLPVSFWGCDVFVAY
jgi:hypothetical protein